jgi:hypothetical protein
VRGGDDPDLGRNGPQIAYAAAVDALALFDDAGAASGTKSSEATRGTAARLRP